MGLEEYDNATGKGPQCGECGGSFIGVMAKIVDHGDAASNANDIKSAIRPKHPPVSLMGDAMSHAILPGVAAAFLLAGLNRIAMAIGGLIAGLVVAVFSGAVARLTVFGK